MTKPRTNKRSRLSETAADLAYRQGFGNTSLADIAEKAQIPLGNIYYYFKTKAEIGEAIAERRLAQCEHMCVAWDAAGSPRDRLIAFIRHTVENRHDLAESGCPIGSFCSELRKLDGEIAEAAARPFAKLLGWIEAQFGALGRRRDKKALAVHLLSSVEGAALLANSFRDPTFVTIEAKQLTAWIEGLDGA
jgi:AcrR family transcriptional regulator